MGWRGIGRTPARLQDECSLVEAVESLQPLDGRILNVSWMGWFALRDGWALDEIHRKEGTGSANIAPKTLDSCVR